MDMDMGSALPEWVAPVATAYLAISLLSALVIAADIYGRGRRHPTALSEVVWVGSALYLGPVAIWLHRSRGQAGEARRVDPRAAHLTSDGVAALLPGGSASAIAHVVAVPAVAAAGWTIAGLSMWPMIIVIAVLAIVMVAVYEVGSSRAEASGGRGPSVGAALFAAVVTVAAFDVGMVGWMLFLHLNDAMPGAGDVAFWFLMQVGVVVGLATGYPAVRWLVRQRRTVVPA